MLRKIPTFKTERLILRGIILNDSESYQNHFNDYDVVSQMASNVPWPYPKDGASRYIKEIVLPNQGKDSWFWGIFLKDDPKTLIGEIDLKRLGSPEHRRFWLGRKFWDKGIMSEAVQPVMDFAFFQAGFDKLVFSNALGNLRSRRIKEKTGSRLIGRVEKSFVDKAYQEAEVWELTKLEWMADKIQKNE